MEAGRWPGTQEEVMQVRSRIVGSLIVLGLLLLSTAAMCEDLPAAASAAQTNTVTAGDPLLQMLVAKGVINAQEAKSLVGTPAEQKAKLLELLRQKGILSASDYETLTTPSASAQVDANLVASTTPILPAAVTQTAAPKVVAETKPAGPAIIPAVMPLRVMPIDVSKQAGMIPDLKLGSGVNLKIYGFFKSSAVYDTASSGGATFGSQDWPLPLLLGNTGPTADPQFHLKARQFRIGTQAEWVPKGSDFTITGRVEGDFEGDYTDVNNRNISGDARSQFSLRLAWVRLDHPINENASWFAEFGEDWSLLGSSTLPSLFETTGLGVGMGSLYERMPLFKTGVQIRSGDFKFQPEFAIVMPVAGSSALTTDQRLRFGDRAGAESGQPGIESRVVFQFPLNRNWKGVAPAEIIFSGHHARMNEVIQSGNQKPTTCETLPCSPFASATVPNVGFSLTNIIGSNCANTTTGCELSSFFPKGIQVGNPQNIWSAEVQLPTPWVTLAAKYYRGNDMRFFFGGQLNDVWSNLNGMGEVGNGISFSGRAILFGCAGGVPDPVLAATFDCPTGSAVSPAILAPIGGSGGFAELSFPLSRIFHANPEGHNSGWVLHMQYGTDRAKYSDALHGNSLGRTDLDTVSLTYRLNRWVTFVHEASYIVTDTAQHDIAKAPVFAGQHVFQAHDWRNEFGPVFTF